MDINIEKSLSINTKNTKSNILANNNNKGNNKYMVVPYTRRLKRVLRTFAKNTKDKYTSKEATPSRTS